MRGFYAPAVTLQSSKPGETLGIRRYSVCTSAPAGCHAGPAESQPLALHCHIAAGISDTASMIPLSSSDLASLTELRRDLHAHPELAFEEHRTAERVAAWLADLGLEVSPGWAGTGVVGVLGAGNSGRCIGLRADMDALPIDELNHFPHRSRHPGKMHACGHDGHTAMLLAAATLMARSASFDGTVVFIFQPAEEADGGARAMIEQGLLERYAIRSVYGLHNWPGLPAGHFAVHAGAAMAGTDQFRIMLQGQAAHAAMPHQGRDPVLAACALVQALQSIVARRIDPLDAAVLSVTRVHAGTAYNVIPELAELGGTVRTLSPTTQGQVRRALEELCEGTARGYGLEVDLDYRPGYPPTINDSAEAARCAAVAEHLVGAERVHRHLPPSMGAEDFAYFLQERPGCYVWLGNGETDGDCRLHNPRYDFNDALLPIGAAYWHALAHACLPQQS